MSTLNKGDIAPDFDLETTGGSRIRLSALRGTPVVVYFYPKANTTGCTQEAVDFTSALDNFQSINASIIGISADPLSALERFREKHALGITLASDPDHVAIGPYGVWVEKSMYGRKFMGIERSTFLIAADGTVAEIWRKVRVKGHAEAVLAAAKALPSLDMPRS